MMKEFLLVIISVLYNFGFSQPVCHWTTENPSALAKFEAYGAVIDDKLYSFSGFQEGLEIISVTEIFDPQSGVWTQGSAIPTPVTHGIAVAVEEKIWLVGGFVGAHPGEATDVVQIYNTINDEWEEGPSLPSPKAGGGTALMNNRIHYFGGLLPDRQTDTGEHIAIDLDALSDGWIVLADLPEPRNHLGAATLNGLIYAIGGQFGHDGERSDTEFVHAYDYEKDEWFEVKSLLNKRSHFESSTFVNDNKIFIAGGRIDLATDSDHLTQYDPITNEWQHVCLLPAKLRAPIANVIGNEIYLSNGAENGIGNPQKKLYSISTSNIVAESNTPLGETHVFPNPSSNFISFQFSGNEGALRIYSSDGNLLFTKSVSATSSISLETFQSGTYYYRLTTADAQTSGKIVLIK